MTDSAMFYKGVAINRFYDLPKDPQANIFFDWAVNTKLEAKDNFVPELPNPLTGVNMVPNKRDGELPDDTWNPCFIPIKGNGNCGTGCNQKPRNVKNIKGIMKH